jgi:Ca2+-binding RTX toxin-like protein
VILDGVQAFTIQLGGADDDTHRASLGVLGDGARGELLIDLGSGHDEVEANSHSLPDDDDNPRLVSANQIFGRDGNDAIEAVADTQGFGGDTLTLNAVSGGDGSDRITARAVTEFFGDDTIADNRISGGDGDDAIDASAINWSNSPVSASNFVFGGRGADVLKTFCLTDSNSSTPTGFNGIWGGDGDDQLEAVHSTDGENFITDLRTVLDGGDGDDTLRADSTAFGENVRARHELDGGRGDDDLAVVVDVFIDSGSRGNDTANVLVGGRGRDRLEASVTAELDRECEEPPCDFVPRARNDLDGGKESDVLIASLGPDVDGASFLNGGSGRDELTVIGGSGNVLDGGKDDDDLFVGDGDDELIGGHGADHSHFDLSTDQGTDTLADFDAKRDVLKFAGIEDTGPSGLADDLDAVSTVADLGPGDDVVVDFAVGTRLVFAARGTGAIDSWADLAPRRALAEWSGPAARALRAAPAAIPLPASVSGLDLRPRDH